MNLENLIRILKRLITGWVPGGSCFCTICRKNVWLFLPYRKGERSRSPLTRELGVIGSNVEHHQCPRCGSTDRSRHLLLYLETLGLFSELENSAILHVAPEKQLISLIEAAKPARYIQGDLKPQSKDTIKINIMALPYDDDTFDLVIANHVLEHVEDDRKALGEIHRVLKIGGRAILQTPYSPVLLNTWEDPGITTPSARWIAYGQEDHVRLYGKDLFKRISDVGLIPDIKKHSDVLSGVDGIQSGVNSSEPLFLFHKR